MAVDAQLGSSLTAAFRFVVSIDGAPVGAFTECGLPTLEWDVEEVKEGGLAYVHQLPGQRRKTTVKLKNGIGVARDLLSWYTKALGGQIERRKVTIKLLDSLLKPVLVWNVEGAFPVKWTGPELKTDSNVVAIQTFELACEEITFE